MFFPVGYVTQVCHIAFQHTEKHLIFSPESDVIVYNDFYNSSLPTPQTLALISRQSDQFPFD